MKKIFLILFYVGVAGLARTQTEAISPVYRFNIKKKVVKVLDAYKENDINHYVRNEIEWYDFGDLRIKKFSALRVSAELVKLKLPVMTILLSITITLL